MRKIIGVSALLTAAIIMSVMSLYDQEPQSVGAGSSNETTTLNGDFTLAVSWHPAFCETARRKAECQNESAGDFASSHFVLHGLWPDGNQAFYCQVPNAIEQQDRNGQWQQLPGVELSDALWAELQEKMPGTQSQLHRHEWIKHGTCSGGSAQSYYTASLALLDALNTSGIRDLFATNIGNSLNANTVRDAFDAAFGNGTGQRVTVECARENGRTMIDELRIAISGSINSAPDLSGLIAAGNTRDRGCPSGEIDRAGA